MTEISTEAPDLSPLEALADKEILLLGTTGFLAKIVLSLLLERFSVKRIYVMIRATRSKSAEDRLWNEVMTSEMMDPLRDKFGAGFEELVRSQVVPISGDLAKPGLGVDPEVVAELKPNLDLVINSAGLVNFNPPLDNAVDANAVGALEIAKFTASLDKAKLVHVSTCFVAGARSGRIREDTPILGYFPKHAEFEGIGFDWARELKDLQRIIEQVKDRTDDAALEATFKKEALERLKKEKRDPNPRTLRAAITNQRRRWLAEEQIRLGIERAQHWGWPNIYTFTKALGEQAIAAQEGLDWCIVRPAIVESALSYPFPGWNEGMNTSAPLAYLGMNGQIRFPGTNDLILDVVPVDYVASAIIAAAAALAKGETKKVYQVAAGDINPCSMARTVTLVGVYRRRKIKKQIKDGEIGKLQAEWQLRSEPMPVSRTKYERLGAPALQSVLSRSRKVLDDLEPERYGPFGGVISRAKKKVKDVQSDVDKVVDAFDLFMPFIWENKYVFRTPQTRGLFARMNEADRSLFPAWDIEGTDWRHYWLDVHLPGLEEWVFPKLETTGPKRLQVSRDYRDLVELFASRTKEHGRRVAYRMLEKDGVADSFTYRDVRRGARGVAEVLAAKGVKKGDRVLLVSEGRPEWGMSYFGVILAGGTVVPVDVDLSRAEIANIARAAQAKGAIASEKQKTKLTAIDVGNGKPAAPFDVPVWGFDELFATAHEVNPSAEPALVKRKPEDVASVIFTSGTTGRPKGVVLTDRNFTALTSRMAALFELNRTDSLLSVLPPHHTFEFSAGLLMPLAAGASVTYLEDRTPELISRAFEETPVSGLIGVPAVWESLHRKIMKEVESQGLPVELLVKGLMRLNTWVRDRFAFNFGKWVFRPMHDAVGGRLRYMVSGAAALKSNIYTDFRGLGFSMYEGYGLTEASPVLTVGWPGLKNVPGSVGWPLPGIEVRIDGKNDDGVGEIIARGPTIMQGYLEDEAATQRALQNGWLRTGDRGRIDDEGRLFIVGREKDVIIDTGGKNVYPDEIEELYAGCDLVKEFSVVGVPADTGHGERVAALVVPDYEAGEAQGLTHEDVRERVRDHFKEVGSKLPFARRVKVVHTWEGELPRTSTRKVRRSLVQEEIIRLEHTLHAARDADDAPKDASPEDTQRTWVRRTVAAIANKKVDEVHAGSNLIDGLGFDSLMQLELLTALESEFPHARIDQDEMANAETVADVVRLVSRDLSDSRGEHAEDVGHQEEERPLQVPGFVSGFGKAMLGFAQRMSYERLLDVDVKGQGNIPANRNFIVASNHSSHLDMGLVKYALGPFGRDIRTLAAKDYFFDDPYRRTYFENFTNLLPMDRHGSLKRSLRMASEAIRNGERLLIFPEGTRARDGVMTNFKPAIGHLCLVEKVDVLPMYLGGTYDALPVGAALPKDRHVWVEIGDPITPEKMREETKGMSKSAAYRHVAWRVEQSVRKMGGLPPPEPPERPSPRAEAKAEESESAS